MTIKTTETKMKVPDRLTAPLLSAYHFINMIYRGEFNYKNKILIAHGYDAPKPMVDDNKFNNDHFRTADLVSVEHFAPIESMSDKTFAKLVGHFNLTINDIEIKTKGDLLNAVAKHIDIEEPHLFVDPRHLASPAQISAWLLNTHASEASIHWGVVADLYNESERDQQEAIIQFFSKCLNRSLEDLLATHGPAKLLEDIQVNLETKIVDGMPYVLTNDDEWIREDLSSSLYTVNGYRSDPRDNTYVIAGAATFEEAVAYATNYVSNIEAKNTIKFVAIFHRGEEVCNAKIVGMGPPNENQYYHSLPARISWDLDTPEKKEKLEPLLIQTEKKMGLRWSKVQKLEDELGL